MGRIFNTNPNSNTNISSGRVSGGGRIYGSGNQPTAPQPVKESTPVIPQDQNQQQKGFNLGQLFGQAVQAVKDPKKTLDTLLKGGKVGVKELEALFVKASNSMASSNPLMVATGDAAKIEKENLPSKIYKSAAEQKAKDTAKLNPVEKLLYGVGEFAPAAAIPIPGAGELAVASPFLKGLVEAGVTNAGQAALLYNPEEHKDGNQLKDFFQQTAENFVFGAGLKGATSIVLKPMRMAFDAITNRLTTSATDKVYQEILPSVFTKAREGTAEISSTDLRNVLTGQKSANDFEFFQSPTWKDTVKKYGANPDNWPDTLTTDKPLPNPTLESVRIRALPSSELHTVLEDNMDLAINDMADGKAADFKTSMAVVKEAASQLETKGYVVNYNDIVTGINNVANYRRSVNDFNIGVLDQEVNKGLIQHLEENGLLKPLLMIKKLYNITQSKPGYTDQKIVDAFSKWGKESGTGSLDEVGDRLNRAGYNVSTDPADIIDFAKKLPTIESIKRKIPPPQDEISVKDIITGAVKTKNKQIETPYAVSKNELENLVKPQEQPIKIDVKAALEEKVKQRQAEPTLKEEIRAPKVNLPEPIKTTVNKSAQIINEIRMRFSPTNFSAKAKDATGLLREYKAFITNDKVKEHVQNKKVEAEFDKLSTEDQLTLINNYETTGQFGKGFENYTKIYKQDTDTAHQILQDVFGLEGYVDNYIKHGFRFNNKVDEQNFVSGFSKSLIQYSTSPLKQRKYVTVKDAMDYMTNNGINFQVVETNPEILRQWTVTNANAAQAFSFLKQTLKDKDLLRFVKFGEKLNPNEDFVNDRWANVMFKGDQGMVQAGRYAAPYEVATLINNSISKGLFEISPTFALLRNANNALNQFQLGISAFHFFTVSFDAIASELGQGIQEVFSKGQRTSGIKDILRATSVVGSVTNTFITGNKYIKALERGDNDALVFLNERINRAGGRLAIENRYRTQSIDTLKKSLKNHDYLRAGASVPFAVIQRVAQPIMETFVPRIKLGRFIIESQSELARATKNFTQEISVEREREILSNLWDKNDNLHGELVQDNLFWNNMIKDSMNLLFRSFGWTYGKMRLVGTASAETITLPKRLVNGQEAITPTMGALMAYPVILGMVGGVIHYFNTGKRPESAMDYFFPQSGNQTPDGRPVRLSVPGFTKEFFHYVRNPVETFLNKMSPELQVADEIFKNQDYYGVMLRNPDDPIAKQAMDMGKYLISKFTPISITSYQSINRDTEGKASLQNLIEGLGGFQKAGIAMQSPIESKIKEVYGNQIGKKVLTQEEWKTILDKSAAKKAALQGDYSKLEELLNNGTYTRKGFKQTLTDLRKQSARGYDSFQEMFSKLSYEAQQRIYKSMSDDEKKKYVDILKPNPN